MKSLRLFILIALTTASFRSIPASENRSVESVSARMRNKLGSYLAIGEPSPTLIGVNVGYNVTDFLRVNAGYGSMSVATSISFSSDGATVTESTARTLGLGVRGFVPGWNLSPTVGLHFATVSYSGAGRLQVGGFEESGSHLYGTIGADWQTDSGFNASLGYRQSFRAGIGGGFYLSAGWFVGWLG